MWKKIAVVEQNARGHILASSLVAGDNRAMLGMPLRGPFLRGVHVRILSELRCQHVNKASDPISKRLINKLFLPSRRMPMRFSPVISRAAGNFVRPPHPRPASLSAPPALDARVHPPCGTGP